MKMEKKNEKIITENIEQNEQTKKEPNYRGIKTMPFVIGNETFEKLRTIGTSANLLVYLTSIFHLSTITATNLNNVMDGFALGLHAPSFFDKVLSVDKGLFITK